jgi:hypothetical protein
MEQDYQDPVERIHELRVKAREAMDAAEATAQKWESEGRDARPDERKKYNRLLEKADRLALSLSLAESEEVERKQRIQEARKLTLSGPSTATSSGRLRVTSEPLTYKPSGDFCFFRDLVAAERSMDYGAWERLQRHSREVTIERRDLSSTDGAGGELVPPA